MRNVNVSVNNDRLELSAEILRAVTHPLRMKILEFIDSNTETHVNNIYNTLGLEQSITSQHLRILRLAELVHTIREGKYIYYSVNYDKVGNTMQAVRNFLREEQQ